MEYLLSNIETLESILGEYSDDFLFFDCPGQIELYTHIPLMRRLVEKLQSFDYRVMAVYLLDSQFTSTSV